MSTLANNATGEGMAIPVVLLVFNRPAHTARVFAEIRRAQPRRLYLIADGPRADHPGDAERCTQVRELLARGVDWPCEVRTSFCEANLGCGRRVSSGIDWVFGEEEEAIFLEDDCVPDPSFFRFCSELLERYRSESRVGQICGCTRIEPRLTSRTSYTFSRYGPVWGWASWRRAWRYYDFSLSEWPAARRDGFTNRIAVTRREAALRSRIYDDLRAGRIDTWDYQWGFAKMRHGLLSVIPSVNLIENIGFDGEGSHSHGRTRALPRATIEFPLSHPSEVATDLNYDRAYSTVIAPGLWQRLVRRLLRLFSDA
jgi:hypothetical protein